MTSIRLFRRHGVLVPESEMDYENIQAMHEGRSYECKLSAPRNYQFHKKFMVLVDVLFQLFNPQPVVWNGLVAEKNRERFRKDLVIALGYHELVVNIKGEVRAEAKSISFAKMDELEFSRLYDSAINYAIRHIQGIKGRSFAEIDEWVQRILDFA